MSVTISGTAGVTFNDASSQNTAATGFGFKNRIINGAMVIDQRNAGASVTPTAGGAYDVDRWLTFASQSGKYTAQQGTTNLPAGFINSLNCVSSSAYSVLTSDYFMFTHRIEGLNVADLAWGTASAATVTLSFWVRSSLTGTFGGSLVNSAQNRSYPFSYSIPSANTPTFITITIAGDTSGTWLTTNGIGIGINFSLGVGSTFSGTAGAWAGAGYYSATGATSVVGTNGATFYITGVQLEKGSTATSFDYRPYGTELSLCQRYYSTLSDVYIRAYQAAGQALANTLTLPVTMRTVPTLTKVGTWTVQNTGQPSVSSANGSSSCYISFSATASADTYVLTPSTSTYITAAAEL